MIPDAKRHWVGRAVLLGVSLVNIAIAAVYMAGSLMIVFGARYEILSSLGDEFGSSSWPQRIRVVSLIVAVSSTMVLLSAIGVWSRKKVYASTLIVGVAALALLEFVESAQYVAHYGFTEGGVGYVFGPILVLWAAFNVWFFRVTKGRQQPGTNNPGHPEKRRIETHDRQQF